METDEKQEATPSVDEASLKDTVPYTRFKEVIDSKNELKNDIETLKESIATLKQQQPEEEELEEPLDWKEAQSRTVKRAISEIDKRAKKTQEEDHKQEQRIENSFEQLKAMGQEITPVAKKAVLTKMIETGNNDVFATYLAIKKQALMTGKTEQQKKEGFVPSSQKGGVAGKTGISYKELRSKSLDDIVEAASKAKQ